MYIKDKMTVRKNIEDKELKIKMTAEEILTEIGSIFSLSQNDIDYIINKTPSGRGEDRWRNLVASMALFIRCPKSKVPPISVEFMIRKIQARGYCIIEKEVWKGIKRLRKLNLYPSFCQIDELKLLENYWEYIDNIAKEFKLASSECILNKTKEILVESRQKNIAMGHSSVIRIFAALYISSILCGRAEDNQKRFTQDDVADMGGTTPVSIRNVYMEMAEKLDIEIII